ncbi:MAG TPA: pyridoxal-phosphate dependent enzyme [Longimicrobiales bacterium]|nr:pyridoxal-phosphate dependent enzyme [Longimicrobiales bacterium]
MAELALFRRYPATAERVPRVPLATLPTPVERLPEDVAPGGSWVKRDDLTGQPYGGNKLRKLELLLGEARRRGARRLVTVGAMGSHHALATTVHGRAMGFEVSLVLFPQKPTPQVVRTLLMDVGLGAELRFTRRMETVPLALLSARWAHRGQGVFVIPAGGSDPLGTIGYVSAGLELAEQVEAGLCPPPDVVHVAGGTLGTAAGMALGLALGGLDTRVDAYRITSALVTNRRVLGGLIAGASAILAEAGVPLPEPQEIERRVVLKDEQLGAGYGRETEAGRAASELLAGAGLPLDPTYTAKAAAGFLAALREEPDATHLYWHTLSAVEPGEAAAGLRPRDLPEPFREWVEGGGAG